MTLNFGCSSLHVVAFNNPAAGDQTLVLVPGRQTLYQLNYSYNPFCFLTNQFINWAGVHVPDTCAQFFQRLLSSPMLVLGSNPGSNLLHALR